MGRSRRSGVGVGPHYRDGRRRVSHDACGGGVARMAGFSIAYDRLRIGREGASGTRVTVRNAAGEPIVAVDSFDVRYSIGDALRGQGCTESNRSTCNGRTLRSSATATVRGTSRCSKGGHRRRAGGPIQSARHRARRLGGDRRSGSGRSQRPAFDDRQDSGDRRTLRKRPVVVPREFGV